LQKVQNRIIVSILLLRISLHIKELLQGFSFLVKLFAKSLICRALKELRNNLTNHGRNLVKKFISIKIRRDVPIL